MFVMVMLRCECAIVMMMLRLRLNTIHFLCLELNEILLELLLVFTTQIIGAIMIQWEAMGTTESLSASAFNRYRQLLTTDETAVLVRLWHLFA